VTLRIAWWGSQTRNDATQKVVAMFVAKHPNLKAETEFLGFTDYWAKLATEAAAGTLPDVMQHSTAYIKDYVSKGLLADLTPFTKDGTLDMSSVDATANSAGTIDGKLYGVTLGMSGDTIVYDPALFQQAGVPAPSYGWTWDDFVKAATTIAQKTGVPGTEDLNAAYSFPYWLSQHGQSLFNKDGTALGYTDDRYFTDFFTMRLALQESGASIPADAVVQARTASLEDTPIVHGKAAMSWVQANQLVALSNAAKRPLALAIYPGGGPGTEDAMELAPSMFFSVSSKASSTKDAASFVSYFTDDVDANKVLLAERGVPISSAVRAALKPALSPVQGQIFDYIDLIAKHSEPFVITPSAGASEVQYKMLYDISDAILYKKISVQDAAAQFRQQATDALTRKS
jgi:multiple sugar transport system substrate-binding protein